MPIAFACPSCAKSFRVADELAGRRSKCPACGTTLTVPNGSDAYAAPAQMPPAAPMPMGGTAGNAYEYAPAGTSPASLGGKAKFKKMAVLSAVVLGVGAVVAVGGWFLYSLVFGPSSLGSDDLKYLPDNCHTVASFRPDEYLESSIAKELKKTLEVKDEQDLDTQLEESLGIRGKDISQIVFAEALVTITKKDVEENKTNPTEEQVLIVHLNKNKDKVDGKDLAKAKKRRLPWRMFESRRHTAGLISNEFYTSFTGIRDIAEKLSGNEEVTDEKVEGITVYKKAGEALCVIPDTKLVIYSDNFDVLKKILKRGNEKVKLSDSMQSVMKKADFSATYTYADDVKGRHATQRANLETRREVKKFSIGPEREDDNEYEGRSASAYFGSDIKVQETDICRDRSTAVNMAKRLDADLALARMEKGYKEPIKGDDWTSDQAAANKKLWEALKEKHTVQQDILSTIDVSSTFSTLSISAKIKGDWAVKAIKANKDEEKARKDGAGGGAIRPKF